MRFSGPIRFLTLGVFSLLVAACLGFVAMYMVPIKLNTGGGEYFEQTRFFAHRGGGGKHIAENSPEAVKLALNSGFDGVELDAFFDVQTRQIVISHDRPYVLRNGELLTLNDFSIPEGYRVWLDVKNLQELNLSEMGMLAEELRNRGLLTEVWVESTSLFKLMILNAYDVSTVFWMYADSSRSAAYYVAVKFLTWVGGIDGVSVPVGQLNFVTPHFGKGSVFTFTENSPEKLCQYAQESVLAVVLTDRQGEDLPSSRCRFKQ